MRHYQGRRLMILRQSHRQRPTVPVKRIERRPHFSLEAKHVENHTFYTDFHRTTVPPHYSGEFHVATALYTVLT